MINVFAKYVMQAHVLGFGILVVLVILLPNGIVGDWNLIVKKIFPVKTRGATG